MCKSYREKTGMQNWTLQEAAPKWEIKEYFPLRQIGSLSNDDRNNNFACPSPLCVHFFAIVVGLWHETS